VKPYHNSGVLVQEMELMVVPQFEIQQLLSFRGAGPRVRPAVGRRINSAREPGIYRVRCQSDYGADRGPFVGGHWSWRCELSAHWA
jgi:hypothetical protein